ncbi:hypothetical protein [Streptomyces collinus]|uniref:hypothetical protein n=1 Tax=Streptomyces collinus TaxID=42684 RepID=UPI003697FB60
MGTAVVTARTTFADDHVIGQVTIGGILPQSHLRRGSLGYWIARTARNQGHAGRAVGLLSVAGDGDSASSITNVGPDIPAA